MATLIEGAVSVAVPDSVSISSEAGKMTVTEKARTVKARENVGPTAEKTGDALEKHADRLPVPGIDAAELRSLGAQVDALEVLVADVERVRATLKQALLLKQTETHRQLRKVLAFVRGEEKFDPSVTSLVPDLEAYFAKE